MRCSMDGRSRIQESLAASGHIPDEDVIEELAAHAAAFYEGRMADGDDAAEAEQHTTALIASWCDEAVRLHRRPRPHAPAPPTVNSRRFVGLMHDLRYAVHMLCRR